MNYRTNAAILDLVQQWLDQMNAAFASDDFDGFASGLHLPFVLITSEATMVQTTIDHLRQGFDGFRRLLASLHATDYIRLVETAEQITPGIIASTYETNILRNGHRLVPPFRSSVTLGLSGNGWKAHCIANGMTARSWPVEDLHVIASPDR